MHCSLAEVLDERHLGSKTDASKNHPLFQTGPSVLREAATRFLKEKAPIPGFVHKLYEARFLLFFVTKCLLRAFPATRIVP